MGTIRPLISNTCMHLVQTCVWFILSIPTRVMNCTVVVPCVSNHTRVWFGTILVTCAHFRNNQARVRTLVLFKHVHAPYSYTCMIHSINSYTCMNCSVLVPCRSIHTRVGIGTILVTCAHFLNYQARVRSLLLLTRILCMLPAPHTPILPCARIFPYPQSLSFISTYPLFFMQLVKSNTCTHLPNSDVHTYPHTRHTHPERTACISLITTCERIRHAFTASPQPSSCLCPTCRTLIHNADLHCKLYMHIAILHTTSARLPWLTQLPCPSYYPCVIFLHVSLGSDVHPLVHVQWFNWRASFVPL